MNLQTTARSIKKLFQSSSFWYPFGILSVLASLPIMVRTMSNQSPIAMVNASPITLNMVILWGAWGFLSDAIGNKRGWGKNSLKTWGLFLVGLAIIFGVMRLSGIETRWG